MLFSIIGSFWLLDSLKVTTNTRAPHCAHTRVLDACACVRACRYHHQDTVFSTLVGLEYQPRAKLVSVAFTLLLVLQYNRALDRIEKAQLFYYIGTSYSIVFLTIATLLSSQTIGMNNTTPDPWRVLGWVSYVAIESYGSIAVALFWAFANSTVHLEDAKSSYGLIIAFAQLGAILGSTLATQAKWFGVAFLYAVAGSSCFSMVVMARGYVEFFPHHLPPPIPRTSGKENGAQKSSFQSLWDGLLLVLRYDYVIMVLGISCLYEVVLTVLDYEMKVGMRI